MRGRLRDSDRIRAVGSTIEFRSRFQGRVGWLSVSRHVAMVRCGSDASREDNGLSLVGSVATKADTIFAFTWHRSSLFSLPKRIQAISFQVEQQNRTFGTCGTVAELLAPLKLVLPTHDAAAWIHGHFVVGQLARIQTIQGNNGLSILF